MLRRMRSSSAVELARLAFDILQRAVVLGDHALLVGDALQLAAARHR